MRWKPPAAQRGGTGQSQSAATPPLKRGPWMAEEDELLTRYVEREGEGRWHALPRRAGLLRCGKSCRLRWMNYLRPDIKRGPIADDEADLILRLHRVLGNRCDHVVADRREATGRTDNEIKNYWNSHLSKQLIAQGIDPRTHKPLAAAGGSPDTTAAADKTAPTVQSLLPPPMQPTSSAVGTGGDDGRASPADGGDDFAATMSPDVQGIEGFGDQFCAGVAARGGFDDMDCALVDADDAFTSSLDSLIDESQFVDYFVDADADHKNVNSENDRGSAS